MTQIPAELLGLSRIEILSVELKNNSVYIEVATDHDEIECQKCGKPIPFTGYSEPRTIRHLPTWGKPCYLIIRPKKGVCKDCDKHPSTWQKLDWCDPKSRHTKAYEQHLVLALVNSTVSIKEAVGKKVVRGVIDRWISQEIDWKSLKKLGLLGIDEIALRKGYQDYLTLVTARIDDQVRLINVIEGREKAKVKAFLKSIPGRLKRTITGICCDMYDGYVNAAGEALPKVPVMIDRFHVAKLYRKALVKVRQAELARLKKRLSPEDFQALKPSIAILKRNAEVVSKEERQELEKLFLRNCLVKPYSSLIPKGYRDMNFSPISLQPLVTGKTGWDHQIVTFLHSFKLKAAYRYCHKLTGIFNSKIGKQAASDQLEAWMAEVERSSLTQFDRLIETLRKYKDQISNYFRKRETSGFVEGLNNKAKVTKRRCYCILSIKTFFQRLFLDTQGYDLFLGTQGLEAI